MTPEEIARWFYLRYDKSACTQALLKSNQLDLLGEGRHFTAWKHNGLALSEGRNLPDKWHLWMHKIRNLGPCSMIPPFEILNKHTVVMPALSNCQSIPLSHPYNDTIQQKLKPLRLTLCDIQIGQFDAHWFIYDWSDLQPL